MKNRLKNHERIRNLETQGYEVTIAHARQRSEKGIEPKGGATIVTLTTPNRKTFIGEAECSSHDVFDKKLGVRIALGRAIKRLRRSKADN
jgi:hypothetical protein